ncbi:hypothetical protein [Pontivivens ytuae]|uniref:DoxX n=1 Tax=Pontivivens ytuae TaxID=2789856 RepID=A0A7S9QD63_9RHOB|nr:hypothetical protein [Pontivivens ytuae]QPH53811.1 hypothetical protein I0K15_18860 [Pontivivens ytuae]
MTAQDRLDGAALLIMRLGLAWFIFVWAANKIVVPTQYQNLARNFDGVEVSLFQVYAIAGVQILLCALAAVGLMRLFSYGGLLIMHFFTVTRRWEGFFDPFALNEAGTFPVNRNQVIDLAILAAMIALVLMIRRDHFSIGGWFHRHLREFKWWM